MEQTEEGFTRKGFIRLAISKSIPVLWILGGSLLALWIHKGFASSFAEFLIIFGVVILLLFANAYPALKRRYGQVFNKLPRFPRLVALGTKVVVLFLAICILLLLAYSMRLVMLLLCIQLLIENYRLREVLEEKSRATSENA